MGAELPAGATLIGGNTQGSLGGELPAGAKLIDETQAPIQTTVPAQPSMEQLYQKFRAGQMSPGAGAAFQELAVRRMGTTEDVMGIGGDDQFDPDFKQNISEAGHEYLPIAGGMIGSSGAIIAGQLGPQALAPEEVYTVPAAGAGGWALGEQAADTLDEMMGLSAPKGLVESAEQAGENIISGLETEALGLGIAVPLSAVIKQLAPLAKGTAQRIMKPYEQRVSKQLSSMEGVSDTVNLAEAARLKENIPGLDYTYGMGAANRDVASLERGAIASAGKEGLGNVQTRAADIQTGNVDAVSKAIDELSAGGPQQLTNELKKQVDSINAIIDKGASKDMQELGRELKEAVASAKAPIREASQKMETDIPRYAMDELRGTKDSIETLLSDPRIPAGSRKGVESIKQLIESETKKHGRDTHTMFGLRRELNTRISQAEASGDTWTSSNLQSVKKGIEEDIAAIGEKARTGQLHLHKGKVVNPDDLASELESNLVDIAKMKQETKIDIPKMREGLKEAGIPQEMYAKNTGQSDAGFAEQITKLYEKRIGEVPHEVPTHVSERIKDMTGRNESIKSILSEVEPGRDVASTINAYNKYTSEQLFNRFETDALKKAKNGLLSPENVPRQFTTTTGADDLIKALGSKDQAGEFMWQHYEADIGKLGRDVSDKQLKDWLRKNSSTLKKYGLFDRAQKTTRSMIGKQKLDKVIGSDINSVFDSILSGNKRAQRETLLPILQRVKGNKQAREGLEASFRDYIKQRLLQPRAGGTEGFGRVEKLFTDLEPSMDLIFSKKQKAQVSDIRDAVALTQRMTTGTPLGGSQTTELANKAKSILIDGKKPSAVSRGIAGSLAAFIGHRLAGFEGALAATTGTYGLQELLSKVGNERTRRYFAEAMFNPEYAQSLIRASRMKKIPEGLSDLIISQATRAGVYAAKKDQPAEEQTNE